MSQTVQKNLRMPQGAAKLISDLASELNMSEATFVAEVTRNYAIDMGKVEGVKNYALEEAMLVPTYEKKAQAKNLADEIDKLWQEMRVIKSILRGIDQFAYIGRDILNTMLLFLHPENEGSFKSTDVKLSIMNRENIHSFMAKSLDNYEERIRQNQIEGSNK